MYTHILMILYKHTYLNTYMITVTIMNQISKKLLRKENEEMQRLPTKPEIYNRAVHLKLLSLVVYLMDYGILSIGN